jgi:hypothetical protein
MKLQLLPRRLFCLALLVVLQLCFCVAAQEDDGFAKPFSVIAYAKSDAKDLKPIADTLSKQLENHIVVESDRNPVCCVWLEITGKPSPGESGYVIVHQAGGTTIQASDVEQLKLAIKRWFDASKETKGGRVFPIGLTTSFKVNQ